MDWEKELYNEGEKPLDTLVSKYSHTSIFRKIAFIGDSLSSGEFEIVKEDGSRGFYDMFEYSWGQFIARANGIKAYNFSAGGMAAKDYIEWFAEEKGYWDKEKACQAYVIALGVNDIYNGNIEIGSLEDIDKTDYRKNKPTYMGFYAAIVSRYKEISPGAKFFFVTVPNTNTPHRDAKTFGIIDALYALGSYFEDSYVIDLYKYGPVYDEKFREKFYLNGHMNPSGYLFTAKIIDSYIDYIVRHNPKDFEKIGFVANDFEEKEIVG